MLHPNGTMLDGTPLADAIARIDAEIVPTPHHYMVGCLYPHTPEQRSGRYALRGLILLSVFAD
jgi:hypothetical protein